MTTISLAAKLVLTVQIFFLLVAASPSRAEETQPEAKDEIEISVPEYIVGGLLGTTVGFGLGHGVQNRYGQRGWLFTMLEGIAVGVFIVGAANCPGDDDPDNGGDGDDDLFDDFAFTRNSARGGILAGSSCPGALAMVAGVGSFIGFHLWEILDVWAKPKFDLEKKKFYAQQTLKFGIAPVQLQKYENQIYPAITMVLSY